MNYLQLISIFTVLVFSSCKGQDNSKTMVTQDNSTKVELIDFYGTHRCVTCEAIESNAKYTVDTYFQNAVNQGLLEFKTINVDNEANYAIAERFEAAGTALFINIIKDGKEEHIDLTKFAFMKGLDKAEFSTELKAKLETILAQL